MSTTLVVPAERLVDVLHGIALRGQTGLLLVHQKDGAEPEQGEIFFEHGETVFARIGERIGESALSSMMNWQKVATAFYDGVVASAELRKRYGIKQHAANTGSLLPIELQRTQLLPVIRKTPVPVPEQESARKTPSREIPALRWKRESQHELPAHARPPASQFGQPAVQVAVQRIEPTDVFRVRPLIGIQQVISGLGRRERLVFLLLDSRRSMGEIAGLIHRSTTDVAHVLTRFLALGLIEHV